jgi:hypothetical protein
MPDEDPTLATDGLPLIHEPPAVVLVNVIAAFSQIFTAPEIGVGSGLTEIVFVAIQPVGSV